MTTTDKNIAEKIRRKILSLDSTSEIILFGSHARGDSNIDSDWDILILVEHGKSSLSEEQKYRYALLEVELEIGQPISVHAFSKSDWETKYAGTPLYENIALEGQHI